MRPSILTKNEYKKMEEKTAQHTYKQHREKAEALVAKLLTCLCHFDEKQSKNPKNWGYAESMKHINEQLENIISQLGDDSD